MLTLSTKEHTKHATKSVAKLVLEEDNKDVVMHMEAQLTARGACIRTINNSTCKPATRSKARPQ